MKKISASVIALIMAVSVLLTAFASMPNRIYADAVSVEAGETITIPVKIENNEGFMGFAVFVTYDKDVFKPVSTSKGSIISGLFNDSISTSKTNSFKVVCSETSNVTANGVLFNLKFDVLNGVSGKQKIELSYSQQDTFDENWKDVSFSCEDIDIIVTQNGTTAPTTVTTTESSTITTTKPSTTESSTTEPDVEKTTTRPTTQIPEESTTKPEITDPDVRPKLTSELIREWADALEAPLSWIFKYPAYFVASIVALFE